MAAVATVEPQVAHQARSSRRLDDLAVCSLAWREAPAMLARHHRAVAAALPRDWTGTVVLVENAAPPTTREGARAAVRAAYPASARRVVLRSRRNLGYARAMDLALDEARRSGARFAALLNSDGRPEPDVLERLVTALESDPSALAAAPAVHGPGERCEPPGPPIAEPRLARTALVVRLDAALALGGFDPAYFFYGEDYDFSDRAAGAGHRLLRVPEAVFHHGKGGRSRRGAFVRELYFATFDGLLVAHHDPSPASAARRIARGRARSLVEHARAGRPEVVTAIALATAALPATSALAASRRRRPWGGERLERWLDRQRPRVQRLEV